MDSVESMENQTVDLPLREGEALLERLLKEGVGIEQECGGTLACASCRVVVLEGQESLGEPTEDELDMLDRAGASAPGARLACQATGVGGKVRVEVPRRLAAPADGLPATPLPVVLTERAARHFSAQLAEHPGAQAVRLSVEPSGCSGFGYRIDPAHHVGEGDEVVESCGVRVAIDRQSLARVHGTTIDVVQEGLSRRLRFENPNARTSCGCGESFGT